MILPLHLLLRDRIRAVLADHFEIADVAATSVAIEVPPNRQFGDLGTPVAFELARRLRKAPKAIAAELAEQLGPLPGIARIAPAANGYLNLFLDRSRFLRERLLEPSATDRRPHGGKTIVEHTAINPNKAAHIGHLRNAALGDTLVRALRFRQTPVEVQNYIDDTGVQVADVVVGFEQLEGLDLPAVEQLARSVRFDFYCWDLYAKVTEWYEGDRGRLEHRARALHAIEDGGNDTARLAGLVADRIVRCHLKTMARLNIDYDLLTWEGDILRLHFWARAFEVLKETKAVFLQNEGRLAGCWVMPIEPDPGLVSADAGDDDPEQREKVIVRSNGTVTYVGKDMAYQMWKSGLLGRDFLYRPFAARIDGETLWATTSDRADARDDHPSFGDASATFNVIDVRQAYLQKLLKQALIATGHPGSAERLTHFSYEMVALSRATARELGYIADEADPAGGRGVVEVSGRKGLGVKADDLLDRVIEKARVEVERRNPEQPADESRQIAERIGIAAVRYFMIKYSRTKIIAFDIDEALSFEGESGPYLQYAAVRAAKIFSRLQEREGVTRAEVLRPLSDAGEAGCPDEGEHDAWTLVLEASRLDEVVEQVIRSLEFSALAKYAFGLAQLFNAFYHRYPVLNETQPDVRLWRAAAAAYFEQQITRALGIMGVSVPAQM